jgi:hypothetical protein
MTLSLDQLLVITPLAIGALAWLIGIEARVKGHDREIRDVKDDINYIRQRIDAALERER